MNVTTAPPPAEHAREAAAEEACGRMRGWSTQVGGEPCDEPGGTAYRPGKRTLEVPGNEQRVARVALDRRRQEPAFHAGNGNRHDSSSRGSEPGEERPVRVRLAWPGAVEVVEERSTEERHVPVGVREHAETPGLSREEVQPSLASIAHETQAARDDVGARRSLCPHECPQQVVVGDILLVEEDHEGCGAGARTSPSGVRAGIEDGHAEVRVALALE